MVNSQDLCLSDGRGFKVRSGTGFVSVWASEIIIKQTASGFLCRKIQVDACWATAIDEVSLFD